MADFDEDDDYVPGGTPIVAMVLPFATAIAALALGAVLGIMIGWVIKPAEKVEISVPRDLTAAELAQACAPTVNETVNELEKAQTKVQKLQTEVDRLEADAYRIPWQDGLPQEIVVSLEPYRERIEAGYRPMCNALEVGLARR